MKSSFKFLVSFLSFLVALAHINAQIELEDILAAPFSSDLTKSDDGKFVAWISNTRGIRSLHSYDVAQQISKVHYEAQDDDGQVIGNIQIDAQGNWLYYVKGSGNNREGVSANPTSYSNYPGRQLVRSSLSGDSTKFIGAYPNYLISKEGDFLLITHGNRLSKLDLSSGGSTEIIRMRGNFSDLELSQDGKSLVFVSNRGDHSFIGTYELGSDRINWLAPGVDVDSHPHFSPDGSKVVFLRAPGHGKGYLRDITGGNSFSVMLYDIVMNRLDTTWISPNDSGGFAQYYHEVPLRFVNNNQISFYSEHEGFMKIYILDLHTGNVKSLIDGDCEIEHSDVDQEGNRIVFSTNCGDTDRRDIASFDLHESKLTRLTTTPEIETNPLILNDSSIAYLKGGYNDPTAVYIHEIGDQRISKKASDTFPSNSLIQPQQVIFQSPDGLNIHGQLFSSGDGSDKPAVIFMHGGPIRQMLLGYHYSSYYANAYAFNQYLASRGYVVLSVNFRSGIGYGRDFRRAENQGPRGASEYQDIVAAAKYLQGHEHVDGSRIGLWGGSYGGFLTAMGLARNSDLFKAGVDLHGVHDWAWRAKDFSPGGAWAIDEKLMDGALASSPVSSVDGWRSPVLFVHGDDDRNVMFGQTIDLVQRLRKQGVEHEILVLPDEVHGFYRWDSWMKTFTAAADFFNRKL